MRKVLAILAFISFSCQKEVHHPETAPEISFREFIIKKGQQFSNVTDQVRFKSNKLSFQVKFDNSAVYTTVIPQNQHDINKLYGFSDNDAHHHDYSARFGWNYMNNKLLLYAYVYNSSQRQTKEIATIVPGKTYNCSITVESDKYIFTIDGVHHSMQRSSTVPVASGYMLYPFFGGDETAPHDIRIWIRDLSK